MEHHFSYHFTGVFILYITPFLSRQVVQQHFKLEKKNCELFLHRYLSIKLFIGTFIASNNGTQSFINKFFHSLA